jgi:tRNA C32,U32 (ribose-2'-O)-methylase TrmJ
MTCSPDLAARFRFVLVRTSHPGNIGSAARAIRTMGFTRMELVAPARFPTAKPMRWLLARTMCWTAPASTMGWSTAWPAAASHWVCRRAGAA